MNDISKYKYDKSIFTTCFPCRKAIIILIKLFEIKFNLKLTLIYMTYEKFLGFKVEFESKETLYKSENSITNHIKTSQM